jgi:hypothetical protein
MQHLDRETARALAEAGFMPLGRYIEMFGEAPTTQVSAAPLEHTIGNHRTRQWSVPAHFASPLRAHRYRLNFWNRRSAA